MSGHFSVKNFDRFQHYKDRSPPWIKLYNELLDDYEFGRLPDASKAHLLAIWLLASRYENKIPYDAEWVSRRINATTPVNLEILAAAGFIVLDQSCSKSLSPRKQAAIPETETQVETETDTPSLRSGAPAPTKKKSRRSLPEDFPDQPSKTWAETYWLSKGRADLCTIMDDEVAKFRDYHTANPKGSADWPGSWRMWSRNAMNFTKQHKNGNGHAPSRQRVALDNFMAAAASIGGFDGRSEQQNQGPLADPVEAGRPLLPAGVHRGRGEVIDQ